MTTRARGYRGSCDQDDGEARLSLEDSRSNVGKEGSSRGFEEKVASFARGRLALATKRRIGLYEMSDTSGSRHAVRMAVGRGAIDVRRELELDLDEEVRLR